MSISVRWLLPVLLPLAGCVDVREASPEPAVPLVASGVFQGRIYLAGDAPEQEREAARHLATWIRRVTGASPEIADEPPGALRPGLYVGATRAAARSGVVPPASVSRETAVRATREGVTVFIVGASPLATRQAAAVFSREVLGVAFLAPGLTGADWTRRGDVVVPAGECVWRPGFAWRAITPGDAPAEREWALDNGFGELPPMNHNLHAVFDAAAYAANPGLFPLVNGERIAPSGRGGYEPQPNLAHPDAPKVAASAVLRHLAAHPGATAFSLSINDTSAWDTSPISEAAFAPERWFRGRRNRTDYVFRFMNATAEALDGSAPHAAGVRLMAYAYYECEAPPTFTLNPRVFPILTADRSEWRDVAFAAEDRAVMDGWAGSGCAGFGIYDYYYGRDMVMPRVFYGAQAASLRHAARAGATLFFGEMNPDWGFDAPKAWLTARLTERPEADAEALLREYFERAYGEAAAPMRRFHDLAERCWSERPQPPRWIRFYREESAAVLFAPETRRAMSRALSDALAALPGPVAGVAGERALHRRCRVLATALAWARADAFADAYDARAALDALPVATDDAGVERVRAAYARCERLRLAYAEACRRWAMSPLNPGTPFDPATIFGAQTEGVAALKCGGRVPAAPFVSAASVLALAPGDGGEVLWRETFERSAFESPPRDGMTPGVREVILPVPPLYAKVTVAEATRLGPDTTRGAAGPGALLIAGTDQAGLARRLPVTPGDTLGATVRYSGKITAGEHVGVYLRFVAEDGAKLGPVMRGVAFPGGNDAWRSLAVTGVAPAHAAFVDVTLRVTSQDAGDAVWFDDLCVRRVAAEGKR